MIGVLLAYYVAGCVSGFAALVLAAARGPLPPGAAVVSLGAFVVAWPALLPWALVSHAAWLLEVRRK